MLLLAVILVGTFALRILICWAMIELREQMQRAGHWMSMASIWAIVSLSIWVFLPMLDLGNLRRNPDLDPSPWEIVQVVAPLVVSCCVAVALTCAWIHVRRESQKERRCSDE